MICRHPSCWLLTCVATAILLTASLTGCSDDETVPGGTPAPPPGPCPPGELANEAGGCCPAGTRPLPDGSCLPAGLPPDMECPPGEMPVGAGQCLPAGVPPEACGQGFEPDGTGGCLAILPAEPCAAGMMAVPGETTCREVAPCAAGTWGDIPVEATTEFVDGSYVGGNSDGSQAQPWTTIQEGIDQAAGGAIVAIAAGSYVEDLAINGTAVRLWGKCPALVEVVGLGALLAAIEIENASGTEVRDLAVTGASAGIVATDSLDLVFDRLWIHDTTWLGLGAADARGAAGLTLSGSLVEGVGDAGLHLSGVVATVERTVVRETRLGGVWHGSLGIVVQCEPTTGSPASATVRSSMIEGSLEAGILVAGSDATIERSVVKNTLSGSLPVSGRGVLAQRDDSTNLRSTLQLRSCVIDRNQSFGVDVGASDVVVATTTIRNSGIAEGFSAGVSIWHEPLSGEPGNGVVSNSLIEGSSWLGLQLSGSDALLVGALVRGTLPGVPNSGWGLDIEPDLTTGRRSSVDVRFSVLDDNHQLGALIGASDAVVEASVVRNTRLDAAGAVGRGLHVQDWDETGSRGNLTLRNSLIERNHELGVFVSASDATIESCLLRETQPDINGNGGRGFAAQEDEESGNRASVEVRSTLLERNHDVGIFIGAADASVSWSVVRESQPALDGRYGRGIHVGGRLDTGSRASALVRATLIEDCHDMGIYVGTSDAVLEAVAVRGTRGGGEALFGDGITVLSTSIAAPSTAHISATHIHSSARSGIANFGGQVSLAQLRFDCNAIDLDGETEYFGATIPYSFVEQGELVCGCGDALVDCIVQSSNMAPPEPVEESPDLQ